MRTTDQDSIVGRMRLNFTTGTTAGQLPVDTLRMKHELSYVCLQTTREGQASHAHVNEIIKGLKARNWDVALFEPDHEKTPNDRGVVSRLIAFFIVQLKFCIYGRKCDVLYLRSHFALLPTALMAKLFGIPMVQEVNGTLHDLFIVYPWTRRFKSFFGWCYRYSLRCSDALIAVTPLLAEELKASFPTTSINIVPNGANPVLFCREAPLKHVIAKPYAVFVGALARWQGIDILLRSVQSEQWPKEVTLVVVGDGVEKDKVKEVVRKCGSRVQYLGKIPYAHVPGIVANAAVAISPQTDLMGRAQTGLYPLKVFEAMACGVPVIVSDFPGQAELVRNSGCGLVVPAGDPEQLAVAVSSIFQSHERSRVMGENGRRAIETAHSWDHRAAQTNTILLRVLHCEEA